MKAKYSAKSVQPKKENGASSAIEREIIMKTSIIVLVSLFTFLLRVTAGQPQEVTALGTYLAPPDLGEIRSTPSGQLHFKGVTAIAAVESPNPLLTGLLTWEGDFQLDPDWNGAASGNGEILVGTWDGGVFTPTAGKWLTKFEVHGNMAAGPYFGKVVAVGVGGAIDGMRLNLNFTGGAGVDEYAGLLIQPTRKNK